jgi:NAD(P)-dependent dehydrogenase (short-subunit alcohol dehydrogenase family)
VYFTGRNTETAEAVITACKSASSNITFIPCDQISLNSVSQTAKLVLKKSGNQLDILICNAGVMAVPPGVSKDGYEIQFAINHLAHALLIKLCLPALLKAAEEKGDARIVSVTSLGFKAAPKEGIIFKDLKTSQENLGQLPQKLTQESQLIFIQAGPRNLSCTARANLRMFSTPPISPNFIRS